MLWGIQDPGRSVGFHSSGAVLAVGTMTGRYVRTREIEMLF